MRKSNFLRKASSGTIFFCTLFSIILTAFIYWCASLFISNSNSWIIFSIIFIAYIIICYFLTGLEVLSSNSRWNSLFEGSIADVEEWSYQRTNVKHSFQILFLPGIIISHSFHAYFSLLVEKIK